MNERAPPAAALAPPGLGGRDLRGWRLARCGTCGLPHDVCLCDELPRVRSTLRVSVVMHRVEALRSTNTGRIVARVLDDATVRVRGARDDAPVEAAPRRCLVLFPFEGARPLRRDDADPDRSRDATLVVPDGTWAQARRIARRDAWCASAEPVCVVPRAPSRYGLRRNARDGGLCTVEAVAEALAALGDDVASEALQQAFDAWRARAGAVRGAVGADDACYGADGS